MEQPQQWDTRACYQHTSGKTRNEEISFYLQLPVCLCWTVPNARDRHKPLFPKETTSVLENRAGNGLPAVQVQLHLLYPPRDFHQGKEASPGRQVWAGLRRSPVGDKEVLVVSSTSR